MNLAAVAVPSAREQCASILTLDVRWIVDFAPWQLWKGKSRDMASGHLGTEDILLAVAGIKHVVRAQQQCKAQNVVTSRPSHT